MDNQLICTQVTWKYYNNIYYSIGKMKRYTNVALPDDLIEEISNILKSTK